MTYAFVLDASACSGCKACQVACKDKNGLPLGVLWRRVYELTGGGWQRAGAAWTSSVVAYNLSMSCNHCVHPKCAGVCPVDAYTVRDDGIVLLDSSRCMGCGYCAWACPYEAPQYDRLSGVMTKCDFCFDNLDLGLAPACVSACPLRVLDYADVSDGQPLADSRVALWETPAEAHPYPLPASSRTRPHLALKPHTAMQSTVEKSIANVEEVRPQPSTGWEEAPLVGFTLLAQAAVGGMWAMMWFFGGAPLLAMLWIGACLGAGLLLSFAHLGNKRNAWRALSHLRKSWLSRELLYTLLFGAGWLVTFIGTLLHLSIPLISWLTALLGLNLVHCMSRVYRLRTVPAWDTWRTEARFFISAGLLGILGMLAMAIWLRVPDLPRMNVGLLLIALLLEQAAVEIGQFPAMPGRKLQLSLLLVGLMGCTVFFVPGWLTLLSSVGLLLIIALELVVGRWNFYQARLAR